MIVLGTDSSSVSAAAALMSVGEDSHLIAHGFVNNKITHSQTLVPLIKSVLECADMTVNDIDVFAVTAGPGSFTGLRIGVSAVKGMAYALNKPCRAVSSLCAAAFGCGASGCVICAVMDARCGQVYNALFREHGGIITRLCEDRAVTITELESELREHYPDCGIVLCGDGAKLCHKAFGGGNISLAPADRRFISGAGVCLAAVGEPDISAAALMPRYLRLPQAERERLAKENNQQGG